MSQSSWWHRSRRRRGSLSHLASEWPSARLAPLRNGRLPIGPRASRRMGSSLRPRQMARKFRQLDGGLG